MFPKVLYFFTLSQILLDSEKVPKALRQADVNRLLNSLIIDFTLISRLLRGSVCFQWKGLVSLLD